MITATVTRIIKKKSQYGGYYYHVFFKSLAGDSYFSYIYEKLRNYHRWKKVLSVGNILSNLKVIKKAGKQIIDADSNFVKVEEK